MTNPDDPNREKFMPIHPDAHDPHRQPPKPLTPLRTAALFIASIAAMLPWPLLGILLTRSQFDEPSEAAMLFGGVTLFPLMILALFPVTDELYIVLLILVWLAAALVPTLWFRRRLTTTRTIATLLGAQSAFSLAQALMGVFLIIGKSI